MSTSQADRVADVRAGWRSVAIPSEHGGWGLTLEPVLLGLVVAWSGAGVALGVAAFTAFLVRTRAQSLWVRRAPIPAKQLGLRLMAIGLALVAVTAVGVLW